MKLFSAAAERNADPIWHVLSGYLSPLPRPQVLEIASGSGQHAAHFCTQHEGLHWQPTDINPDALASIAAYRYELPSDVQERLKAPVPLDVTAPLPTSLAAGEYSHVLSANMIHIAPRACTAGLFATSQKALGEQGRLILYGPFIMAEVPTAPSNLAFDRQLKAQCPDYGIRHFNDVSACAADHGFSLLANHSMPANNRLLVFERVASKGRIKI